jgi:hypothetical protein
MAQFGQVTASTLNLRSSTSTSSTILAALPTGKIVEVLRMSLPGGAYPLPSGGTSNLWDEVKVDGQQGFVASAFILDTGNPNDGSQVLGAIFKVNAGHPYYSARDITLDGRKETFCNCFFGDVMDQLGISIPRYDASAGSYPEPHPVYGNNTPFKPFSAEALFKYFTQQNASSSGKWKEISSSAASNSDAQKEAVAAANKDKVVVVSYPGRPGKQGHIAILRPDSIPANVRTAQAGTVSGNNIALTDGFGRVLSDSKFFIYVG